MNKVIVIGRLTRDPELRHTPNGTPTCNITVAVDRPVLDQNGQRQADFIPVVAWNKQAENITKYLVKGRLVAVDGRIQTRNYDDKDGKRVYVTEVVANNVQFLESKNSISNNQATTYQQPSAVVDNMPNDIDSVDLDEDPFASFGESIAVSDNDLPF